MTLPVQNKGGTGMAFPNGSWTGLIGELQANRADLALSPMAITYHRIQLAHFTPQVLTEYMTILAGFPDEMEVNVFGTLMVFQWETPQAAFTRTNKQMCKLVQQNWWAYTSAMFMERFPRTCRRKLAAGRYYLAKESTFPRPIAMAARRSINPTLRKFIDER
ncbi:hypothetical protein MRX96_011828 [Rhipicephalus microplus]